ASFSATAVLSIEDVDVLPDTVYFRALGDTARLKARALDKKGAEWSGVSFAWGSLDPGVVSVTTDGLARARGSGVGRIVASAAGKSDTAVSVVTPQPVRVVASVEAVTLNALGDTVQLSAVAVDANGTPVPGTSLTYQSSNPSVATVDAVGRVIARAVGQALILIGAPGCVGDTVLATVRQVVAAVSVEPASASLTAGGSLQLTATASDSNGYAVGGATFAWSSSNTAVATVNQSGLVTAVAQGSATITASSGGKTAASSISVAGGSILPPPVATVTVQPSSLSLTVGQTAQLGVVLKDANGNTLTGRTVTWSSSNPSVATVSASGLVTAVEAGSATITATSEGKSGTAAVSVSGGGDGGSGGTGGTASGPCGSACPNEPAGFTKITDRPFDALGEDGWDVYGRVGLATDGSAPRSPGNVGQIRFAVGHTLGTAPGSTWKTIDPLRYKRVYYAYWLKLSPNWDATKGVKISWLQHFDATGRVVTIPQQVGQPGDPLPLGFYAPSVLDDGVVISRFWYSNYRIQRDRWYRIEVLMVHNTPGVEDGSAKVWVTDLVTGQMTLVFDITGIGWEPRSTGAGHWSFVGWDPTLGSDATRQNDTEMYMWMDHFYVSGAR
ncbi:MAG TPA: Ig-like domain-containing protein, partial [Dehalococcoidia bacterium]|nr:Ig-like domain-containing protein [Dehalococcoidia bacterium]